MGLPDSCTETILAARLSLIHQFSLQRGIRSSEPPANALATSRGGHGTQNWPPSVDRKVKGDCMRPAMRLSGQLTIRPQRLGPPGPRDSLSFCQGAGRGMLTSAQDKAVFGCRKVQILANSG